MINAIRMVLLFLLFNLNGYAGSLKLRDYVLPKYFGPANRALIQGSFLIEIMANEGKVKRIAVVSHEITGAGNKVLLNAPAEMKNEIINALSKWEFDQENPEDEITFSLRIIFRLGEKRTTGDKQGFTFSVREDNGCPAEIIIQADRLR